MAKRNWESNPWFWFGVVVASGVTTAVISAALQKYWGLMKLKEIAQKSAPAQVPIQPNLGKYQYA